MNIVPKACGPLLGRALIAPLFLFSGYHKISGFSGVAAAMAAKGMPFAELFLLGAIAFELGGGLMVLLGWHARLGAMLLAVFTVAATIMFHNFWSVEAAQYRNQLNHFMKNVAILGGLVYIMATGPGRFSLGHEAESELSH